MTQPTAGAASVAVGDGNADDTNAIQERLDLLASMGSGSLHFPPGTYRVTRPLRVPPSDSLSLEGVGVGSTILWSIPGSPAPTVTDTTPDEPHPQDLFVWRGPARHTRISGLRVLCSMDLPARATAFNMTAGAQWVWLEDIQLFTVDPAHRWGSGIRLAHTRTSPPDASPGPSMSGEVTMRNCHFWRYRGTAIELRDLNTVVISGCRLPSIGRLTGSIGIHLAGNTGGVWIDNTDVSEPEVGLTIDRTRGRAWNRELFMTAVALDAAGTALLVDDDTFLTITGSWLASSVGTNVRVRGEDRIPRIEITGGTIFNAGSVATERPRPFAHHGAVIDCGTITISGVMFDNNAGVGLTLGPLVRAFAVTGCTFVDNWALGADLSGFGVLAGNMYRSNGTAAGSAPRQFRSVRGRVTESGNASVAPLDR